MTTDGDEEDAEGAEPAVEDDADPSADGQPDVSDQSADLDGLDLDADDLDPAAGEDDTEESVDDGVDAGDASIGSGEWGDMYVSLCCSTTNSIIEKHGDGHTVDEAHFREVDLDVHFNRTLEKYSASGSDMPPEQALVVGTLVAVGAPVALHTDLPDQLRKEVDT